MIKETDLMVGDWVQHNDKPKTIDVIWPYSVSLNDPEKTYGSIYADKFSIKEIQPIELTPEILEKNGWVKFQMYYRYRIDDTQYLEWYPHEGMLQRLYIHKDNSREIVFTVSGIYYVHELQHALKLLKIDKEIIL
jgi:hypothetical protein